MRILEKIIYCYQKKNEYFMSIIFINKYLELIKIYGHYNYYTKLDMLYLFLTVSYLGLNNIN
jgi:hypothetical protein